MEFIMACNYIDGYRNVVVNGAGHVVLPFKETRHIDIDTECSVDTLDICSTGISVVDIRNTNIGTLLCAQDVEVYAREDQRIVRSLAICKVFE